MIAFAVLAVVPLVTTAVVVHVGGASHVGSHCEVAEGLRVLLRVVLATPWLTAWCSVLGVTILSATLVVILVVVVFVLVALLAVRIIVVATVLVVLSALLAVIVGPA